MFLCIFEITPNVKESLIISSVYGVTFSLLLHMQARNCTRLQRFSKY